MSELQDLIHATGFDTYEQAMAFVQESRSLQNSVDECCREPRTPEEEAERQRRRDELRIMFGNAETEEAHKECLQLRAKISTLEKQLSDAREDGKRLDWLEAQRTFRFGHLVGIPEAPMPYPFRLEIGLRQYHAADIRAAITAAMAPRCPKCGSTEIHHCHVEPPQHSLETDFEVCEECSFQWGHQ